MIYVIQINVKYVFHKKYQARKLFKDILYIPGGSDLERIDLTDDLQLPSNHNRSFTRVILQGQNIDDMILIENNHIYCLQYQTKVLWGRAHLYLTDPRIVTWCYT